ncbi:hypothetical protein EDD29_5660 [Actinocorallia herbida]|uniref:Lactoylglutathione lyase n=1 Tax=Actinocorallia herbida TaxID=58109 RepID=A0A3N1D393_9ACTN|nr:lactoylglutathione lyase [Actinocorallia herbida]ROO88007.1 hypothetical protein EDD29_5660 [Actinocorallia herbida]
MFQFLLSADFMVPDPDATAALFVKALGVKEHPRWRQAFEDHPYVAHFLRVHRSLAVAPTRIEPQGHLERPNRGDPFFPEFLKSLEDFQGPHRPIKTHSLVLLADDLDGLVSRLTRRRLPFRIAPMTPDMPWVRLWVGVTPENPRYEPSVDGGLCIEVLPVEPLQMPPETFAAPEPRDLGPGDMVRVTARGVLVRDLDETLRRLSANLDWEPAGPVEVLHEDGCRRAEMGFTLPHSASVDLLEPTRWDSETGSYLNTWGPGPYYTRISVNDLGAKAADLESRGTPFTWVEESEAVGGPLIKVAPEALDGAIFEFHEHRA